MSTYGRSLSQGRGLVRVPVLPYPWNTFSYDRVVAITATTTIVSAIIDGTKQQSTGRGGMGNIRALFCSRAVSGPDDYSDTRGRDLIPAGDPYRVNGIFFSMASLL
jgi:hypothetical protein